MSETYYAVESARNIGIVETLEMAGCEKPERVANEIRRQHLEGMERAMQNKREHGFHPITAFEAVYPENAPESVKLDLIEGQLTIFEGGFWDDRTDEEKEYIEYLEEMKEELGE